MNAAAIDLGSNSIKILIVRKDGRSKDMQVLFRHRSTVRLGEGTFKKKGGGKIPRHVQLRALKVFQNYSKLLDAYDVDVVRATGTSALRDADNGPSFVEEVREKTGIALEVLPSQEEARLIVKGVASEVKMPSNKPALFIDIGGGSCEISLATKKKIEKIASLPLGAVRLTEHYLKGKPNARKVASLTTHVRAVLKKAWPDPKQIKIGFGSAGTIRAVGRILEKTELNDDSRRVKSTQVEKLALQISRLSKKRLDSLPGVDAKRAEILTAGVIVLKEVLKYFKVDNMFISQRGLREGLLIDIFESPTNGPALKNDDFETEHLDFIHRIGHKYHSQQAHCYHVWQLARQLFEELSPIHGLEEKWKKILMVSSLLHDVGKFVNLNSSHKHSFYILRNTIFPFLSEREVLMVSVLARYHRKSTPKDEHEGYRDLNSEEKRTIVKLAGILRMADALDAQHDQGVRWLKCQWGPGKLKIHLKMKTGSALDWDSITDKFKLFETTFNLTISLSDMTPGENQTKSRPLESKAT